MTMKGSYILVHLQTTLNNDHGEYVGHTIELISTLNALAIILWVHIIYQPIVFNTRGS